MRLEQRLLDVVDAVYAAALDPDRWDDVLRSLCGALDGAAAGIRVQQGAAVSQRWTGLDPKFEQAYLEHYATQDPWVPAALRFAPGACRTSQELLPDEVLERTAFYNELCRPHGMRELVGGLLENDAGRVVSLAVMRHDDAPAFRPEAARGMDLLVPHVRRALEIQRRLGTEAGALAWSAIDVLPVAVLAVDRRGRILRTNRRADALLAAGDGLTSRGGVVAAVDPGDDRRLSRLVTGLVAPAPSLGEAPVARLSRANGKRPLALVAIRLPQRSRPDWQLELSGTPEVLLAIADDDGAGPPVELLRRLYGLTAAEARVALLVGAGQSPREVAEELGVAWNTVRYQLRQAFEKLDVRRQSELARLLASLGCLPRPDDR